MLSMRHDLGPALALLQREMDKAIADEACVQVASLPRYLGALRRNGYLARDGKADERHYWLLFDRDITRQWAWDAAEIDAENDSAPSRPSTPINVPARFQPAAQAKARDQVKPDPRTVAAGADTRSQAQRALDDAKTALAAWTPTRKRYRIGDREMEFNTSADIVKLVKYWEIELKRERRAQALAEGRPDPAKTYVRINRA